MKKSEEKHIWKCVYCGARIKAGYWFISLYISTILEKGIR